MNRVKCPACIDGAYCEPYSSIKRFCETCFGSGKLPPELEGIEIEFRGRCVCSYQTYLNGETKCHGTHD